MKTINTISKVKSLILLLALACILPLKAQITGLSKVKLFLDPGHSQRENMGLYNYSEAEKVLYIAQTIKEYLLAHTDMQADNIKLCRENDNVNVTLTQRTDAANAWGANFYYSIHSDAGNPSDESTLFMYGGWNKDGVTYEKTPYGGKDYGEILTPNLTGVMRLPTRGNKADQINYYGNIPTHASQYPYLHVNRVSTMASLLSEGGYHTNAFQQARNLNKDYRRLEAYATFESLALFLKNKYGVNPTGSLPVPGIAFGTVKDDETGVMINNATITINDGSGNRTYVTDSYTSLFNKYTTKPNEIHNGFFFFDNLAPGATANIKVEVDGYEPQTSTLVIPATLGTTTVNGMGVKDFTLTNVTAPVVSDVEVTGKLSAAAIDKPMVLTFSRKMNRTSVESAISILPATALAYSWSNDFTLKIDISQLEYETAYTLTIDGQVAKNSVTGQYLDGNNDGVAGDNYILGFTTGEPDTTPPAIISYDPQVDSDQEESARPIVRIEFSEPLNSSAIAPNQITVMDKDGETVGGVQHYTVINGKSVLHYFFTANLNAGETYKVILASGIEDLYGNQMDEGLQYSFKARTREITTVATLDKFDTMGTWWQPDGSGSTGGVDKALTRIAIDKTELATTESTGSLRMNYLWEEPTQATRLIRLHNTASSPKFSKDNFIQYYLFGDGSHTKFRVALRAGSSGSFYASKTIEMDWLGWKKITWDIANDPFDHWILGGTDPIPDANVLNLTALGVEPAPAEYLAFSLSSFWIDELLVVKIGDYLYTGTKDILAESGISVYPIDNFIKISAETIINEIHVYSLTGGLVKSVTPGQSAYNIETSGLNKGVYIVKVTTSTSQKNVKIIVK